MKTKFALIVTILFLGLQYPVAASQTLNVTIKNLKKTTNGTIRIAFFGNEADFKKEKILFEVNYEKSKVKNGELCVEIPVKTGTYGLSVLDDENNTGKMEYNRLGIPKKGFGFSNFILRILRKPKFTDFSFHVAEKEEKNIEVKMKYL